jgi:hypothetical protein
MATLAVLCRGAGDNTNSAPMAASYDYTDISAEFFDAAKARFSAWANCLHFKKLDTESNPSEQGFEPVYDLVIARGIH